MDTTEKIINQVLDKIEGDSVSKNDLSKILTEVLSEHFNYEYKSFCN